MPTQTEPSAPNAGCNWLLLTGRQEIAQTSRGLPLEPSFPGALKYLFTQNYLVDGEALGQKRLCFRICGDAVNGGWQEPKTECLWDCHRN